MNDNNVPNDLKDEVMLRNFLIAIIMRLIALEKAVKELQA